MTIGYFLNRLGRFIQSLSVMVMRPDDLVEYSRQTYSKSKVIESWSRKDLVDPGLIDDEKSFLENIPLKTGPLLLLGVGGGREAIHLAKRGFRVTGVDFVPDMLQKAKENAFKHGVKIEGLVQDIYKLNVPSNSYDIVWLCSAMYSCVPTRKRRVEMLKRIRNALKPGGYFLCQFHFDSKAGFSPKVEFFLKIFAYISLGNLWYEKGDMLWGNVEFIHAFPSEDMLRSEFEEGGFQVIKIDVSEGSVRGGAILRSTSTSSSGIKGVKK